MLKTLIISFRLSLFLLYLSQTQFEFFNHSLHPFSTSPISSLSFYIPLIPSLPFLFLLCLFHFFSFISSLSFLLFLISSLLFHFFSSLSFLLYSFISSFLFHFFSLLHTLRIHHLMRAYEEWSLKVVLWAVRSFGRT